MNRGYPGASENPTARGLLLATHRPGWKTNLKTILGGRRVGGLPDVQSRSSVTKDSERCSS
jgi:hypothetical protein